MFMGKIRPDWGGWVQVLLFSVESSKGRWHFSGTFTEVRKPVGEEVPGREEWQVPWPLGRSMPDILSEWSEAQGGWRQCPKSQGTRSHRPLSYHKVIFVLRGNHRKM